MFEKTAQILLVTEKQLIRGRNVNCKLPEKCKLREILTRRLSKKVELRLIFCKTARKMELAKHFDS